MDYKVWEQYEYSAQLQQRVMKSERALYAEKNKKSLKLQIINQKVDNLNDILSRVYPGYDYKSKIDAVLEDESKINTIPENLINIYVDEYMIKPHGLQNYQKTLQNIVWPIKNGFVSLPGGEYGTYRPYRLYKWKHEGIDINNYYSDEVIAPYDCNIWKKYYDEGGGWTIEMKFQYFDNENNKNWYFIRLRHLNKIFVKKSQIIKKGELVGSMGNTGIYSTGKHLHLELWEWNGSRYVNINPVLNNTWKNKYYERLR
jgi:murein DD-endopeptidase MepM/ murein hydrolase activator NlpD